jgi:hypothetical protein
VLGCPTAGADCAAPIRPLLAGKGSRRSDRIKERANTALRGTPNTSIPTWSVSGGVPNSLACTNYKIRTLTGAGKWPRPPTAATLKKYE